MKLTFERQDIESMLKKEAADLLLGNPSLHGRIVIDMDYQYGGYTAVCSLKDGDNEHPEIE